MIPLYAQTSLCVSVHLMNVLGNSRSPKVRELEITALAHTGFFLAPKCPPRSSYSPCANPCPATCLSLNTPKDCPAGLPCTEGCECQKGHILSGTSCVPFSQCGCINQDGSYHPVRG